MRQQTEHTGRKNEMKEDQLNGSSDSSPVCSPDEHSDDDYSDYWIALHDRYYGRWAAERWLLRVYLRRWWRFLCSRFGSVKKVENISDKDLF
jgi:hypothetical protein